jgi:Uma2 family endonuclease
MSIATLMTAEDLEAMPDDGYRYELVRGELIRMAPANFEHLEVTGNLIAEVGTFVKKRGLGVVGGEGGFILARNPDTVRGPDMVFVRADRVPRGKAKRHFVELAPDLVAEVRSPSDILADLMSKADEYLAAGTRLVWIFDPVPRRVYVRTPDGQQRRLEIGDELDGGDVLPGFRLPLTEIFSEPI